MTRRIGVNLTWLVPGVVGGSEEATIAALGAVVPTVSVNDAEMVLFVSRRLAEAHPALAEMGEVVVTAASGGSRFRRIVGEATELPRLARHRSLDGMHHAGGVLPLRGTSPATVMVHDIQPLDNPGNFSRSKVAYLKAMLLRTVRGADGIGVPSRFVAERVGERLGASPERVHVVPWCVLEGDAAPESRVAQLKERHALDGPFVLYPAVTHPHKNHAALISAATHGDEMPTVVFCGGAGSADAEVRAAMAESAVPGRFRHLGRVARADLLGLLDASVALVFPSRYEGFGLPVLEAMTRGVPVIASSAGSLPEIMGSAGTVVDPDDTAGWAAALARAVADESWRADAVSAGRLEAARFGPQFTADALWDLWSTAMLATTC